MGDMRQFQQLMQSIRQPPMGGTNTMQMPPGGANAGGPGSQWPPRGGSSANLPLGPGMTQTMPNPGGVSANVPLGPGMTQTMPNPASDEMAPTRLPPEQGPWGGDGGGPNAGGPGSQWPPRQKPRYGGPSDPAEVNGWPQRGGGRYGGPTRGYPPNAGGPGSQWPPRGGPGKPWAQPGPPPPAGDGSSSATLPLGPGMTTTMPQPAPTSKQDWSSWVPSAYRQSPVATNSVDKPGAPPAPVNTTGQGLTKPRLSGVQDAYKPEPPPPYDPNNPNKKSYPER